MYQSFYRLSLFVLGINLVLAATSLAMPQRRMDASKLFDTTSHDFGTLARGAKAIHEFKISNPYNRPLVISSVRSSCGCTRASVPQKVIQPHGKGVILAEFNTRSFLGNKSATVTVVLSKPVFREVQLRVRGNIRGDIVFNPGQIEINNFNQGEAKSAEALIHYAGSENWKIVDVKSSLDFLRAKLQQVERKNGSVKYKLTVTVTDQCPAGLIRDQLTIMTNDSTRRELRLPFLAHAVEKLSVSPAEVLFAPSQPAKIRLIVRSKQPFQIQKMECGDSRVQAAFSSKSRTTQLVTLTYTPGSNPQTQPLSLKIVTDIGEGLTKNLTIRFK